MIFIYIRRELRAYFNQISEVILKKMAVKCKNCSRSLNVQQPITHSKGPGIISQFLRKNPDFNNRPVLCSHYFFETEITECSKMVCECGSKLGSFGFNHQCSCGTWVDVSVAVLMSKVDID